jgi:hypothetical protein
MRVSEWTAITTALLGEVLVDDGMLLTTYSVEKLNSCARRFLPMNKSAAENQP